MGKAARQMTAATPMNPTNNGKSLGLLKPVGLSGEDTF